MSRIGKKHISVPDKVSVTCSESLLVVKGSKGELSVAIPPNLDIQILDSSIEVIPLAQDRNTRSKWGMVRSLINNAVTGASVGYSRSLEIEGVGYRASVQGETLVLALGYSHDVIFPIPSDIVIQCPKPTEVVISGIDKQRIGQIASEIRSFRPPEPYKGKGVRYTGEYIFRKEGKKK